MVSAIQMSVSSSETRPGETSAESCGEGLSRLASSASVWARSASGCCAFSAGWYRCGSLRSWTPGRAAFPRARCRCSTDRRGIGSASVLACEETFLLGSDGGLRAAAEVIPFTTCVVEA